MRKFYYYHHLPAVRFYNPIFAVKLIWLQQPIKTLRFVPFPPSDNVNKPSPHTLFTKTRSWSRTRLRWSGVKRSRPRRNSRTFVLIGEKPLTNTPQPRVLPHEYGEIWQKRTAAAAEVPLTLIHFLSVGFEPRLESGQKQSGGREMYESGGWRGEEAGGSGGLTVKPVPSRVLPTWCLPRSGDNTYSHQPTFTETQFPSENGFHAARHFPMLTS